MQRKFYEMQEEQSKDREIFIQTYSDVIIEMELFMDHLSFECQKIDALMNYYQIIYRRVISLPRYIISKLIKESKHRFFVWIQKQLL